MQATDVKDKDTYIEYLQSTINLKDTQIEKLYNQISDLLRKLAKFSSDGGDIVSTGLDSRDGNTVGDDRKSSKQSKRKR